MEKELLLEAFAYGIGYGLSMFWWIGLTIYTFDLICEIALEKRWKRKSFIGKLSSREYSQLEEKVDECAKDFNSQNLKELGTLLYCFVNTKKIEVKNRKKFWDKLKFWKKKDKNPDFGDYIKFTKVKQI